MTGPCAAHTNADTDTASRAELMLSGKPLGTLITSKLQYVINLLAALRAEALRLGGDPTGRGGADLGGVVLGLVAAASFAVALALEKPLLVRMPPLQVVVGRHGRCCCLSALCALIAARVPANRTLNPGLGGLLGCVSDGRRVHDEGVHAGPHPRGKGGPALCLRVS